MTFSGYGIVSGKRLYPYLYRNPFYSIRIFLKFRKKVSDKRYGGLFSSPLVKGFRGIGKRFFGVCLFIFTFHNRIFTDT